MKMVLRCSFLLYWRREKKINIEKDILRKYFNEFRAKLKRLLPDFLSGTFLTHIGKICPIIKISFFLLIHAAFAVPNGKTYIQRITRETCIPNLSCLVPYILVLLGLHSLDEDSRWFGKVFPTIWSYFQCLNRSC